MVLSRRRRRTSQTASLDIQDEVKYAYAVAREIPMFRYYVVHVWAAINFGNEGAVFCDSATTYTSHEFCEHILFLNLVPLHVGHRNIIR